MAKLKTLIVASSESHLRNLILNAITREGRQCNLNHIDVSQITDMSHLFQGLSFNGDISQWDVANVFDMDNMFFNSTFNGDISLWDVANVRTMKYIFHSSNFCGNVSRWNINPDANLTGFCHISSVHPFTTPNLYHWLSALEDPGLVKTLPASWKDHFNMYAPFVLGVTPLIREAAQLLHRQWLIQPQNLNTTLAIPSDFLSIP